MTVYTIEDGLCTRCGHTAKIMTVQGDDIFYCDCDDCIDEDSYHEWSFPDWWDSKLNDLVSRSRNDFDD